MPSCTERFTEILDRFRRAVANQWRPQPYYPPLGMRIYHFVGWTLRRLPRALERARQGWTPPKPRPRPDQPRPAAPPKSDRAIAVRAYRFPLTDRWLLARVPTPHRVAGYGSHLEYLFTDPEVAPLLSNPQVNRLLRPICRMLGVSHSLPPPTATPPATAQPATPPPATPPPGTPKPALVKPPHPTTRNPALAAPRPVSAASPTCPGIPPRKPALA